MDKIKTPKFKDFPAREILADRYQLGLDKNSEIISQILQYIPFLKGLSSENFNELAEECTMAEFESGLEVIRQGEEGDRLYIVLKGRLNVFRNTDGKKVLLGEVRRNQIFGESVIIKKGIRSATVFTEEKSLLLYLSTDSFNKFLDNNPELRAEIIRLANNRIEWAERQSYRPPMETLIKELAAITGVQDEKTLIELENEVDWVAIPRGFALIKTGDPGEHLFFLLKGNLDVFLERNDGSKVNLGNIKKGEIVGEIALMTNAPRTADVYAADDSELLRLSKAGYEMLISKYPETLKVFSYTLASRLVGQLHSKSMSSTISSMPIPTDDECGVIVNNPDKVLRNLQITQMYHRLSVQLSNILGQHDANWCTFATHASKTAGYSIRREELPGYSLLLWLEDNMNSLAALCKRIDNVFTLLSERIGILAKCDRIIDHVSLCIAAGNLKVFAELAPLFAAFLRAFQDGQNSDRRALEILCAQLEPGHTTSGGQQLVKEAFTYYMDAMFETNLKRKSELMLCGNVLIGLHEQTRLQPYIVEALNTPIEDFLDPERKYLGPDLIETHSYKDGRLRTRILLMLVIRWRKLLTRYMMRLRLPYGDISLGRDLPKLPNRRAYPDILQDIDSPQLRELLDRFDKSTGEKLRNSRSNDWGNLDDRMNFIINLFRSRHKSLELFDQPFFYEQRLAMQNSIIPKGRL